MKHIKPMSRLEKISLLVISGSCVGMLYGAFENDKRYVASISSYLVAGSMYPLSKRENEK